MKTERLSKLVFVCVLVLGVMVAWTTAMPQSLSAEQGDSLTGGACRKMDSNSCDAGCTFVGSYSECIDSTNSTLCCKSGTNSSWSCQGGGEGCSTSKACDYDCDSAACTL